MNRLSDGSVTYISSMQNSTAMGLAGERRLVRLAEIVFWGSLALALYAYGLYPLLLWLMSRWCAILPPVTVPTMRDRGPR